MGAGAAAAQTLEAADNTIHDQSHNLIHNLVQYHLRNAKSDPQVESLKLCAICCQLLEKQPALAKTRDEKTENTLYLGSKIKPLRGMIG